MSRGYFLDLSLESDVGNIAIYKVLASGWNQPQPRQEVGLVTIDFVKETWELETKNDWENETFYLVSFNDLINPTPEAIENKPLNKELWWWNMRLFTALHKVMTQPENKQGFTHYQ